MNELFNILTNNDWSFDYVSKIDFLEVRDSEELNPSGAKNVTELKESIKGQIKNNLTGTDCNRIEYGNIVDHIALSFYCDKKYEKQLEFLGILQAYINHQQNYSNKLENWVKVHTLLQLYFNLEQNIYRPDKMYEEQSFISESVIRLRKNGLKITIDNGNPHMEESVFKNIIERIEYRKNSIGGRLLNEVLIEAQKTYKIKHDRYYLRTELRIGSVGLQLPFGYLYNLALTNLTVNKKTIKTKVQVNEIFELSKDLMCISRLQRISYFESVLFGNYDILSYLRKNILHDQLFTIQQYSSTNAKATINGIFNSKINKEVNVNLDIYFDIYDLICTIENNGTIEVYIEYIVSMLQTKYLPDKIRQAVDYLSLNIDEVNTGYIKPFDIDKINIYTKPFVKNGDVIYYILPNFHRNGFIFALYQKLIEGLKIQGLNTKAIGKKFGDISEEFTSNLFRKSKVCFKKGLEYKIPKDYLIEIGVKSEGGECDFIIETDDKIVFIEQKSKTLTANARKGDVVSVLLDISQSLLNSLEQSGRHEYLLRKDGLIQFTDGSTIHLNGRNVEKVSLTLFDFYSVADVNTIRSLVTTLLNSELIYSGQDKGIKEKIDEINATLEKLKTQYSSDLLKKEYLAHDGFLITTNIRFFSSNQLISMLEYSRGNEEFLDIMSNTRQLTNNTQDWFFTFGHFVIDLRKLSKKH